MKQIKALYAFLSSPQGKTLIHRCVTSVLAVYTALKSAGVA